jgi:hypothetical protein
MRHLGILAGLILALAAGPWPLRAAAPVAAPQPAVLAGGLLAPPASPAGCPLYRACMQSVDGGCFCDGFFCNGQFICGVPIHLAAAGPSSLQPAGGFPGRATGAK